MARRLALLIGNSTFDDADSFSTLRTPPNDARDFARALREHGDFEITDILIEEITEVIRGAIGDLYGEVERGDLALLYYSGHGFRSHMQQYYLIAKDTRLNRLPTSGISEALVQEAMIHSKAQHCVVVLDCCFSGAFIEGNKKSGAEWLLLERLKGEAAAILASSGRIQYSFEEDGRNSLFTQYLLQGINTGQADKDEDGLITVQELFNYAEEKARQVRPDQTPMIELRTRESQIVIAKSPRGSIQDKLEVSKEVVREVLGEPRGVVELVFPQRGKK